jgi:UDP-N-acetylmuramyl pentapeptide phosphotransferase/UDP-N-acetylglucosamine-1-phosphate transferase
MNLTTADILILLSTGLTAFLVSFGLTPLVKKFALKRGWVIPPHPRRIHKVPMVSIGGLAIFAGFVVAIVGVVLVSMLLGQPWQDHDLVRIGLLLVGGSLVAGVMLLNDIMLTRNGRELSPSLRLVCQFLAAALVILPQLLVANNGLGAIPGIVSRRDILANRVVVPDKYLGVIIDSINIPDGAFRLGLLAIPLTLFWIMGMTNTVNWIDGLDGLAAGVVFIGAATLFFENLFIERNSGAAFPLTSSFLALALACAILGFLPYNWNPAKIFMGDVGAMFLGYALAVIAIIDGAKVAATLLIIGFPVLDVAWVIIYRLLNKRSPFRPDRSHFHHRLLDLGLKQKQIVSVYYLVCGLFGSIGLFVQDSVAKLVWLTVLVLLILPLFIYIASRRTQAEIKADRPPELETKPVSTPVSDPKDAPSHKRG